MNKKQTAKSILLSLIEYAFCFVLYMAFTTPIHEWIHLTVLQWFGGNGFIIKTWYGAGVVFTKEPSNPTIVAFSGGIGIAILYALIFYWDWIDKDIEEAASVLPLIGYQLAYGVFEGIYIYVMPFSEYLRWAGMVATAGFCIGLIPSFYLLIKRLLGEI